MGKHGLILFSLVIWISCNSNSPPDFSEYLSDKVDTNVKDGLYIVINLKSCSSCNAGLIKLLSNSDNPNATKITLILMGEKVDLRYFTEVELSKYRTIWDIDNSIVEVFPLSSSLAYLIFVENGVVVYNRIVEKRVEDDKLLMKYLRNSE